MKMFDNSLTISTDLMLPLTPYCFARLTNSFRLNYCRTSLENSDVLVLLLSFFCATSSAFFFLVQSSLVGIYISSWCHRGSQTGDNGQPDKSFLCISCSINLILCARTNKKRHDWEWGDSRKCEPIKKRGRRTKVIFPYQLYATEVEEYPPSDLLSTRFQLSEGMKSKW